MLKSVDAVAEQLLLEKNEIMDVRRRQPRSESFNVATAFKVGIKT